jgi:membrane-associated phospholipid phosphatase
MARLILVLALLGAGVVPATAEETPAWPAHRDLAKALSFGPVVVAIVGDTVHAWKAEDRRRALVLEGARIGVTVAAAEVVKRLVHRERPDGSDRLSFYSEHTALTAASAGWRLQVTIPLVVGAGYLRMAGNVHHPTDVAVGALAGALAGRFIR